MGQDTVITIEPLPPIEPHKIELIRETIRLAKKKHKAIIRFEPMDLSIGGQTIEFKGNDEVMEAKF